MKTKSEVPNKASISYNNQNLTNLSTIPNNVPVDKIDFSGNPIIDFTGLKVFPELHNIDCSNTKLVSFNNFPKQAGVEIFTCKKTPLCSYPLLFLMSSIVFGPSLESVNGLSISQLTKTNAEKMSSKIRPFLVKGWVIQNIDPVKIVHSKTRQRKTIYFTQDQEEKVDNEIINNDNLEESEQEVYLEDYSDPNEEEDTKSSACQLQNDSNEDEILRERFMRLQETVLLELKRPDVLPTIIKGGRVTILSNYPSRATSSLSTRKANQHPRAQTSLDNYSSKIKANPPK